MDDTEPPSQHYNLSYNIDHIPIQRIFHFSSLSQNFKAGEMEINNESATNGAVIRRQHTQLTRCICSWRQGDGGYNVDQDGDKVTTQKEIQSWAVNVKIEVLKDLLVLAIIPNVTTK